jgi:transposase InsO family protein
VPSSASSSRIAPWTSGKIERPNRTLATEWAYRKISQASKLATRTCTRLNHYNSERIHTGIENNTHQTINPNDLTQYNETRLRC